MLWLQLTVEIDVTYKAVTTVFHMNKRGFPKFSSSLVLFSLRLVMYKYYSY